MKLVVYPPVEPERLEKIVRAAEPMRVVHCTEQAQAVVEIRDADAFFGKITPEMLAASTQLRWVQSPTASLEHYLFPELIDHPCKLTNMRGLFSDVIADHVMAYVLCFARHLHRYIRQQIRHEWQPVGGESERSTFAGGPAIVSAIDRAHLHVSDHTMGIVGLGYIGKEVARRAKAFGMRVTACDPQATQSEAIDQIWPTEGLPELLASSDFVVICAPHTPQTEKLFQAEQFRLMKRSAYLINIGRGIIVDLQSLYEALQQGEIAGAALDVFEVEPLPEDHPLWDLENVLITPHVAAASTHIAPRHLETLLDNIRRFVTGQPLRNVVDKHLWY